jgi:hypothetical protein
MDRRTFLATPMAAAFGGSAFVPEHPRLYYTAGRAAEIRGRLRRDAVLQRHWARLIERANRLLNAALVKEEIAEQGGGQHANYVAPGSQISDTGPTLGLAWHVTGERKYADKLREALLYYSKYRRWGGQGLADRVPPWHSELNTARFCFGFATGYDAVHDFLSEADRVAVSSALARLGVMATLEDWILPETRIHALDSMGHNWWGVCVSMAGVAALALLGEDPRAPEWLDRIQRGLALWFDYRGNVLQNKPANFDRSGGALYEGINYTNYALSEYLRFRLAYANVFPGRVQPAFQPLPKLIRFFVETLYPASDSFLTINFGDSGLHANAALTVRLLLETGFRHPCAGWYLNRVDPEGALRGDPFVILARQPIPPAASPATLGESVEYPDTGWAVLRSSWKDNATLLAVKSGFTWNHTHADAGSFLLFHEGVPVITDSGATSYGNPLYGSHYVQSRAHNVILFNGEGEPQEDIRRGVKFPGHLHSLLDGLGLKYVYADATGPMAPFFSRNYRHWLWLSSVILIFDEVRAHREGRFDWLLHYEGSAEAKGGAVTLANGNARCDVRFLFPKPLETREEAGYADHRPDRTRPYFAFSTTAPSQEAKFVVAVMPYSATEGCAATVEPLSGPNAAGVRVTERDSTTDVYLNAQADGRRMHENTNNVIAGYDTDAYLFAVTRPQTRYFVSAGSYLRKEGRVILDSLSKLDAIWRPGPDTEIVLAGQDRIEAVIGVDTRPSSLRVNGGEVRVAYSKTARVVEVRSSR